MGRRIVYDTYHGGSRYGSSSEEAALKRHFYEDVYDDDDDEYDQGEQSFHQRSSSDEDYDYNEV